MAVTSCIGDALNELLNVTRQVVVEDMLYIGEIPKTTRKAPAVATRMGKCPKRNWSRASSRSSQILVIFSECLSVLDGRAINAGV